MLGIFFSFPVYRRSHKASTFLLNRKDSKVPLIKETRERGCDGGKDVRGHRQESHVEFKPIQHPTEPSYEDRPVKCPMSDSAFLNAGDIPNELFAESWPKRAELASVVKGEVMMVVTMEPPARSVCKRHHTLTHDHTISPVFRGGTLRPMPIKSSTIFHD